VRLRDLCAADRQPLAEALAATAAFTAAEIEVALELLDAGLRPRPGDDYRILVADLDGRAAGYACWGPTPLAAGVYDLYWIVVHPRHQGAGVGRALVREIEARLQQSGARLLLVETASKPEYAATRRFYDRLGFREAARIRDFYRVGDDKIVYEKRWDGRHP
jgi:ribosomal protein S18 acetylase RimI-like enzyme